MYQKNPILHLENFKSNLIDWCTWFIKFLNLLSFSLDLVHIMKILSMNRNKRIDIFFMRGLMYFSSNSVMIMLPYTGALDCSLGAAFDDRNEC